MTFSRFTCRRRRYTGLRTVCGSASRSSRANPRVISRRRDKRLWSIAEGAACARDKRDGVSSVLRRRERERASDRVYYRSITHTRAGQHARTHTHTRTYERRDERGHNATRRPVSSSVRCSVRPEAAVYDDRRGVRLRAARLPGIRVRATSLEGRRRRRRALTRVQAARPATVIRSRDRDVAVRSLRRECGTIFCINIITRKNPRILASRIFVAILLLLLMNWLYFPRTPRTYALTCPMSRSNKMQYNVHVL